MKKFVVIVLALVFVLLPTGCNEYQPEENTTNEQNATSTYAETDDTSKYEYRIEEDENGETFLVFPLTNRKIRVFDEQKQYLDRIDMDLLQQAVQSLRRHTQGSGFYLQVKQGHLYLCVEEIVDIDNPSSSEGGCGIDHRHVFYEERITN